MRLAALVVSAVWGLYGVAWPAGSDLDPSFAATGVVVGTYSSEWDQAQVVAVQPDGQILVGGDGLSPKRAFVARYDASGTLDPTFGTGGIAAFLVLDTVSDIVVQPDGKIVIAGPAAELTLVRLNADGSVDTSFGTGGVVETGLSVGFDRLGGLVLQPDGRVVAGATLYGSEFALARFLDDGTVDSTFGAFGIAQTPVGTDGSAQLFDLVLQPDGMLVAGGEASSNNRSDLALARFDPNGQLDPTFGVGGVKVQPVFGPNFDERLIALVLQPDGKIVGLGGFISGGAFIVVRWNASGALDTTFRGNGFQIFGVTSADFPEDIAISASGRLVVSGESSGAPVLARVLPNGDVDDAFGMGGVARYVNPPLTPCCAHVHSVAIQADGRIVGAGYAGPDYSVNGFDVLLFRTFGSECGNGIVENGEDCEGTGACCDPTCSFSPAGTACTDDGLTCTRDVCDAAGGCAHPGDVRTGCAASTVLAGAQLALRDDANNGRDALVWRWRKGSAVPGGALGDPLGGTSYRLCGFAPDSSLRFQLDAPAAGTCAGKSCWRARGDAGFGYRDPAATPSGTTVLTALSGPAGRPRAVVKGKGANLTMPALPLDGPTRVQLQATNGFCVDSTFSSPGRNDARRYRAKAD